MIRTATPMRWTSICSCLLMIIGIGYVTISYSARSTDITERNDGLLHALGG